MAPRQQFAINHGTVGQPRSARFHFRKAIREQFFTATPQERPPTPSYQLRANAVPLPLQLPVARRTEGVEFSVERMREVERIRTAPVGVGGFRRHELRIPRGTGLPCTHETVRDGFGADATHLRQCAHDEAVGHAHAKATGEQLVEEKARCATQLLPRVDQRGVLLMWCHVRQWQQPVFHPPCNAVVVGQRPMMLRFGNQQRHRFGEITRLRVALLE